MKGIDNATVVVGVERDVVARDILLFATLLLVLLIATFILPLVADVTGSVIVNNQFLIGPAVNAALIVGAIKLRKFWSVLPIVFVPSVAAFSLNLLFAIGNQFMLLMIPAIWFGNMALVLAFWLIYKGTERNRDLNGFKRTGIFILTSIIGVSLKVGIIFGSYLALVALELIPYGSPVALAMWSVMGVNQLITATLGSIIAFGIIFALMTNNSRKLYK